MSFELDDAPHQFERFVAEYADDVQVFRPPQAAPVLPVKPALAAHHAANRFNLPAFHAHEHQDLVVDEVVNDKTTTDISPPSPSGNATKARLW